MTKLTAAQFRQACSFVEYCCDTLGCSVTPAEKSRSACSVRRAVIELESAALARRNADCEAYRAKVLRTADRLLAALGPVPRVAIVAVPAEPVLRLVG